MDGQMRLVIWVLAAASALRGTGAACGPEYLPPFENGRMCDFAVEGHDLGRENAYRLYDSTARNLLPNPGFELGFRGWRNCWQGTATPGHDVFRGLKRPIGSQNEAFCQTRWTKYRAKPERGHLNDFIAVWQVDFRLNSMIESGGSEP